jgi:hypothetical protein
MSMTLQGTTWAPRGLEQATKQLAILFLFPDYGLRLGIGVFISMNEVFS